MGCHDVCTFRKITTIFNKILLLHIYVRNGGAHNNSLAHSSLAADLYINISKQKQNNSQSLIAEYAAKHTHTLTCEQHKIHKLSLEIHSGVQVKFIFSVCSPCMRFRAVCGCCELMLKMQSNNFHMLCVIISNWVVFFRLSLCCFIFFGLYFSIPDPVHTQHIHMYSIFSSLHLSTWKVDCTSIDGV